MEEVNTKNIYLWTIAFVLTVFLGYYQRITGPTYPISGTAYLGEEQIGYSLERTHSGDDDHLVIVNIGGLDLNGTLIWKRYKVNEAWNEVAMVKHDSVLSASLTRQPPSGKLIYKVILTDSIRRTILPDEGFVIIRFKDDVPTLILVIHIILIFLSMLFSTRTGLEVFNNNPSFKNLTLLTVIIFIFGGFVFGPIVQKYAFGEYWTGFPYGSDLTDNKVLLAFLAWLPALFFILKNKNPKKWIIFASVFMFVVFLIPHSLLGSELDYNQLNKKNIQRVNSTEK